MFPIPMVELAFSFTRNLIISGSLLSMVIKSKPPVWLWNPIIRSTDCWGSNILMYASTFARSPLLNASSHARRVLPAGVSGMVACPKLYPIVKNRNPTMTSRAGFACLGRAPDISECKTRILASRCIRVYLLTKRDHSNTLAVTQWHKQSGKKRWEGKTLQRFGTRIDRAAPHVSDVPEGIPGKPLSARRNRGERPLSIEALQTAFRTTGAACRFPPD